MAKALPKPQTYLWEGMNKRGLRTQGETNAMNAASLKVELRRQGIQPTKVKKKPKALFSANNKSIKPLDIAVVSRQLATMMEAGIPLVQSFDIISRGCTNSNLQKLLMTIKHDVEEGNALSDALRKHPKYFNDLYCNLITAGEQSGALDHLFNRIATYKEKIESIKKKIKKALFYPAIVVVVAILVSAILLIFVVPQFEQMFNNFGANLPALTMLVINLSELAQAYWWIFFGVMAGGIYGIIMGIQRSKKFARSVDRLLLRIPIIGNILKMSCLARFARTLSTTFAAGLPLVDSLEIVAGSTGNIVYHDACLQIREDVKVGHQIQQSMKDMKLFPPMVIQMISIGEESGSLEQMLSKIADFYEEDVDNAVDNLSTLIEPMIMVFLGVIVGGLVIAMYLPIFQLGKVI